MVNDGHRIVQHKRGTYQVETQPVLNFPQCACTRCDLRCTCWNSTHSLSLSNESETENDISPSWFLCFSNRQSVLAAKMKCQNFRAQCIQVCAFWVLNIGNYRIKHLLKFIIEMKCVVGNWCCFRKFSVTTHWNKWVGKGIDNGMGLYGNFDLDSIWIEYIEASGFIYSVQLLIDLLGGRGHAVQYGTLPRCSV